MTTSHPAPERKADCIYKNEDCPICPPLQPPTPPAPVDNEVDNEKQHAPAPEWEAFVSFIRPFKNRAYTEDTAWEIERWAASLLSHQATQLMEAARGVKKRAKRHNEVNGHLRGVPMEDHYFNDGVDAVLSELKKLI